MKRGPGLEGRNISGGSRICEKGGPGFRDAVPGLKKSLHFFPWFFFFVCVSFTLWGRGAIRLPDRPPGWKAKRKQTKNNNNILFNSYLGRRGICIGIMWTCQTVGPLPFRYMQAINEGFVGWRYIEAALAKWWMIIQQKQEISNIER